ncbi:MAG: glycosyltransferase [Chitinophagaceae bacterium]|nr:glycosyltransferase [Chitinophagaceae bacterium]
MALKISIITVSCNSASTIRDTLECVAAQNYPFLEHIIIDGGSSDNTLDIIKEFEHVARVVSEKDNGLYDAMNKGLSIASGDIIGILNSDDVYTETSVLSKVAAMFQSSGAMTVYGDLQYVKQEDPNKVIRYWKSGPYKMSSFYYGWMPPHPAFFVKKEVYDKVGYFSTGLRSAADYEIMLRILVRHKYSAAYLPEVLVKMRMGGLSNNSLINRIKANIEDRKAWKLNEMNPYFFTLYLKPLRKTLQFLKK